MDFWGLWISVSDLGFGAILRFTVWGWAGADDIIGGGGGGSANREPGSYMGGCQNDGPFLDPYYNTASSMRHLMYGI